jgi:hypothetical protein
MVEDFGNVMWNFSKLTMKFTLNGKRVIIRRKWGNNVTIASSHRMERILKKTCKASLVPNLEGNVAFKGGGMIRFSRTFSKSSPCHCVNFLIGTIFLGITFVFIMIYFMISYFHI